MKTWRNRVVLGLLLLAVMSLFLSTGCDNGIRPGRRLSDAKDEAETWLEKRVDEFRREADEATEDIEDFFADPSGQAGACAAAPLALSAASLTLVLSRKRTTHPGGGRG